MQRKQLKSLTVKQLYARMAEAGVEIIRRNSKQALNKGNVNEYCNLRYDMMRLQYLYELIPTLPTTTRKKSCPKTSASSQKRSSSSSKAASKKSSARAKTPSTSRSKPRTKR